MDWDGERQRGVTLEEIERKHVERYQLAAKLVHGKRVLDAACGCGYGSCILKNEGSAYAVLGIDYSADAIIYAKKHWQVPGVNFIQHDLMEGIDIFGEFDVVVSFETIEHLPQPLEHSIIKFISILKPYGTLILSHPINESSPSKFHYHYMISQEKIRKIMEDCGLKIIFSHEQPGRAENNFNYHIIGGVRQ